MMNKHDLVNELGRMHSLLALSRNLLQADNPIVALDLVGKALADLTRMDNALLLVRADETEYIRQFDRGGIARWVDADHPLYRAGLACMKSDGRSAVLNTLESSTCVRTVLAAGVPPHHTMTAVLVEWDRAADMFDMKARGLLLAQITELTSAAFSKLHTHASLEQQVSRQAEKITDTAQAHAAELTRRDDVEHEIRELSLTDAMTGLRNRRGFFVEAEQAFRLAQRQKAVSAVIFADIDGLKRVNDVLGHDAGDRLICDAADILRASFRNVDVVARLGGDEFAAFTFDDGKPEAVVERINRNLRAFNLKEGRAYQVSLSIGIVQCDPAASSLLHDYVRAADAQMYTHKHRHLH